MNRKKVLKEWNEIPKGLKNSYVKEYYNILNKKVFQLKIKRYFDIILSIILILILWPIMVIIALLIYFDSSGPIFFRQVRITQYGQKFRIYKFRTMYTNINNSDRFLAVCDDERITQLGKVLRKYRLDEIPQLFNVFLGNMSFVGARPEVPHYVNYYSSEMLATLLLPAGITSLSSIVYKDEADLLQNVEDVEKFYIQKILPQKMKINLFYLKNFSLSKDIRIMIETILAINKKSKI